MFCGKCGAILPNDAVLCPVCGAAAPNGKKPKRKGKKSITKIVLIALAALIVVGLAVFLIVRNTPLMQIKLAAESSFDDFKEAIGEDSDFGKMLDIIEKTVDDNAYTIGLELEYYDGYEDSYNGYDYGWEKRQSIDFTVNYDGDAEEVGVNATYKVYSYYFDEEYDEENENSATVKGYIYADDESMLIQLDNNDDEVYLIPLADFGERFSDSDFYDEVGGSTAEELEELEVNLFADTSLSEFKSAYEDVYEEFEDSTEIEKTDEDIPGIDSDDMTVYRADIDPESAMELIGSYYVFQFDAIFGKDALEDQKDEVLSTFENNADRLSDYDMSIYAGIMDGKLVALSLVVDDGRHEDYITLSLEGEDNIWDEFYVYYGRDGDDETVLSGGIESKSSGFKIYAEAGGYEYSLTCKNGTLSVYRDDSCLFEAKLDVYDDDETFALSFTYDDYDVVLEYGVLQESPDEPDGDVIDVFDELDMDDLQEIVDDMTDQE